MKKLLLIILLLKACALKTPGIAEMKTDEITETTAEYVIIGGTGYPTDITELTICAYNDYGKYCMPKREVLEKLGGVTKLYIIGEFLGDINEITALTNVTDLEITANTIDGIGAAAELPNLKRLTVSVRHGVDLSALSEFTGLEYLNLDLGYTAVDLESIKKNANLTDLYVEVNNGEIINIDALSGLTGLKNLSLTVNGKNLETE